MSQQKGVIENESMGLCLSRCLLFRRKLIYMYIGYRLPSKVASRRERIHVLPRRCLDDDIISRVAKSATTWPKKQ